jgi:hypothetical protein
VPPTSRHRAFSALLVSRRRADEGAVAECISLCVRSCEVGAAVPDTELPMGAWVQCESPCRIDLAGGWSDTPPICYEHTHGGTVINAAITVGGKCPIGAKCRRVPSPAVRISIDEGATFLEYTSLDGCVPRAASPLTPSSSHLTSWRLVSAHRIPSNPASSHPDPSHLISGCPTTTHRSRPVRCPSASSSSAASSPST